MDNEGHTHPPRQSEMRQREQRGFQMAQPERGGLRTALFSYLLAKRTEGQFVLRIEDTDQKRLVAEAEARLCDDLKWAGLSWDEGPDVGGPYGPYKQSLRNDIYQKHASELLRAGQAYRCFCTPQTSGEAKAAYVTSGCYQNCSSLPLEQSEEKAFDRKEQFTVRLCQPSDASKRVYPDLVYGKIQRLKRSPSAPVSASEDEAAPDASDTILVKSDGTPTYHFANVVDDHLMRITHVIRGSEWMASTPLHYDIYSALDWVPPQFAHVGLLVDGKKAKLSKRNAELALDVASMRDRHDILPAPLINFLVLLGWSNPTTNDVMELDDMVRNFDLKFTKGNTMVRMQKLRFLQKAHVGRQCETASTTGNLKPIGHLIDRLTAELKATWPNATINRELAGEDASDATTWSIYVKSVLLADSKSYEVPAQFLDRNRYFFIFNHQTSSAFEPSVPSYKSAPSYKSTASSITYNKAETLASKDLHPIATRICMQSWRPLPPDDPSEVSHIPHADTERAVDHLVDKEVWLAVLTDLQRIPTLAAPPEKRRPAFNQSAVDRLREMELEVSSAPEAIAKYAVGAEGGDRDVEAWVQRFKAAKTALQKYLRERLTGGLPGPHVGAVMAILGRQECARRLGVDLSEEGIEEKTTSTA